MHVLVKIALLQQCAGVFFLPHHSVGEHAGMKLYVRCLCAGKMSLVSHTHPPIGLHRDNFLVELPFHKVLEIVKHLKNVRFFLKQIDPCIFAMIINKAHIIIMATN